MKCLILAAGKSSRLQLRGNSKPLIPVLGKPLIERVISSALKAEADDFYVVTGYRGELITAFLKEIAEKLDVKITTINNDDWEKENGISVLKARDYIDEPFLCHRGHVNQYTGAVRSVGRFFTTYRCDCCDKGFCIVRHSSGLWV